MIHAAKNFVPPLPATFPQFCLPVLLAALRVSSDGQEEVYVTMSGKGEIEIDGERFSLEPDTMVRVSAGTMRKLYTGDEPVRVLALGGCPGKAYEPSENSKLGNPDPLQRSG